MQKIAKEIAEKLRNAKKVKIVSHIDADGITSGSIASLCLKRIGKEHSIEFVKQLDNDVIEKLKDDNCLIWLTDLGSGQLNELSKVDVVITDHHIPSIYSEKGEKSIRRDLFFYSGNYIQLNPHLYGKNGAIEISGAGCTYFIAREFGNNFDLSQLAIVGAIGDLQDTENRKLIGYNREILNDGKEFLSSEIDIRFFGRETRPIYKLLQYATDPILPTLTGDEKNCITFLMEIGINLKENEHWRTWTVLSKEEKRKIISEIVILLLKRGFGYENAQRVIGEVYTLIKEEKKELRDTKEFATLLNSCGRYGKANIGYEVCLGDRDKSFKSALSLLQGHRKNLVDGISFVNDIGIVRRQYLQYFHAKDKIHDTIIGTVANMILNTDLIDSNLPLFAFAETEEEIKVSGRARRNLIARGLNLAIIIERAAKVVNGYGGGHNIAAGGVIPKGKEEEFLNEAEKIVKEQMEL